MPSPRGQGCHPKRIAISPVLTATPSPSFTPQPTTTVEPELAILQAVISTHPNWYCQGPSGNPGHRQITDCYPYGFGTHPTNGTIDNYGSPAAAQAAWQTRRSAAQSQYPIFSDLTYDGYPGYYAVISAYPYAHYEEYFWEAVWVFGAVSSDDTQYRGAPYIAAAIADAVLAYGGQQGTPTAAASPTVTPTSTPSIGPYVRRGCHCLRRYLLHYQLLRFRFYGQ